MGEPLIEQLQRAGLPVQPFQTTNATKTSALDALAPAFERGEIRILPDSVLIAELQAYEMERLPSGLLRYSAPDGMHDDCVMSLAMAWQELPHLRRCCCYGVMMAVSGGMTTAYRCRIVDGQLQAKPATLPGSLCVDKLLMLSRLLPMAIQSTWQAETWQHCSVR